jgi:hypothetical protein
MGSRLEILGGGASKKFPCVSEARDGRNRSVVSSMKAKKRIPLRLFDIAVEKVDPAFPPMVNADQSGTTVGGTNA